MSRKEVQNMFDTAKVTRECVEWIKNFFEMNGQGCNAVVGISGGKDSSVTAALCVEALGKERVIGVLMPCGEQEDIDMASPEDMEEYYSKEKQAQYGVVGIKISLI